MSFDKAYDYLAQKGFGDRVKEFEVSSATVELAAKAIGTECARIAKSLTFMLKDGPLMVICAGDVKVANSKYKEKFHEKARMLTKEEVAENIGHEVGGVCPFGINPGVNVYLDESLRKYDVVFPACGSSNSAVRLTPDELFTLAGAEGWVDVCKGPGE